jgi:hypothetical protein
MQILCGSAGRSNKLLPFSSFAMMSSAKLSALVMGHIIAATHRYYKQAVLGDDGLHRSSSVVVLLLLPRVRRPQETWDVVCEIPAKRGGGHQPAHDRAGKKWNKLTMDEKKP